MGAIESLNFEQLGTSGIIIALLFWLYRAERTERIKWQQIAFDISVETTKELNESARTFEKVMAAMGAKDGG